MLPAFCRLKYFETSLFHVIHGIYCLVMFKLIILEVHKLEGKHPVEMIHVGSTSIVHLIFVDKCCATSFGINKAIVVCSCEFPCQIEPIRICLVCYVFV